MPIHNALDLFAKDWLAEILGRGARTLKSKETVAAAQQADLYVVPDPTRTAELRRAGLIGRLCDVDCFVEACSTVLTLDVARELQRKQLGLYHAARRDAEKSGRRNGRAMTRRVRPVAVEVPFPRLVVTSPGRPRRVLAEWGCQPLRAGVHSAARGFNIRLVVISELPRTRETLTLRLLGRGRVFKQAIDDLAVLPQHAWEASTAFPLMLRYGLVTEDALMQPHIQVWFDGYKAKLEAKGRKEGRKEGRVEGERLLVRRQLVRRFGKLPAWATERIDSADGAHLRRWADRLLTAPTLERVLGATN
jgi:hypothetical protein